MSAARAAIRASERRRSSRTTLHATSDMIAATDTAAIVMRSIESIEIPSERRLKPARRKRSGRASLASSGQRPLAALRNADIFYGRGKDLLQTSSQLELHRHFHHD